MKTNQTQHTSGPWHTGDGKAARIVYAATGYAVADATVYHSEHRGKGTGQPNSVEVMHANAARIVACVNACEGMPDPGLSIEALQKSAVMLRSAQADLAALRAQRDELAAALRSLARHDTFKRSYDGAQHETDRQAAYAALAKVQP